MSSNLVLMCEHAATEQGSPYKGEDAVAAAVCSLTKLSPLLARRVFSSDQCSEYSPAKVSGNREGRRMLKRHGFEYRHASVPATWSAGCTHPGPWILTENSVHLQTRVPVNSKISSLHSAASPTACRRYSEAELGSGRKHGPELLMPLIASRARLNLTTARFRHADA